MPFFKAYIRKDKNLDRNPAWRKISHRSSSETLFNDLIRPKKKGKLLKRINRIIT